MILEIDWGNSLIKWRIVQTGCLSVIASGFSKNSNKLIDSLDLLRGVNIIAARIASVRSDEETENLVKLLKCRYLISVVVARPERILCSVKNGYADYQQLGVDRWLALVAAYKMAAGSCLVIDFGTAVTSDFVSCEGEHLGGFICPGLPLMRKQLCSYTKRVRVNFSGKLEGDFIEPGRTTGDAVEGGCLMMLRGFVDEQVQLATRLFDRSFQTFFTGGDSGVVSNMSLGARIIPDLVFIGLALACPLNGEC